MSTLLQAEWFKLRKSKIVWLLFTGPLISLLIGLNMNMELTKEMDGYHWYILVLSMNLAYSLLFLPLISGVFASVICRYEHQAGGWKQLLALPVTRWQVFAAKYIMILLIILVMQILYLGVIYTVGILQNVTEPFPMQIVQKSIFGGWIATFPLVALQLWMSILFKSFAAPFAVNVIFTLPSILIINSEKIAPFYPWVQPFSMMYIESETDDVFFIPWEQLLTVVGGSFVLFFIAGLFYFQRKAV